MKWAGCYYSNGSYAEHGDGKQHGGKKLYRLRMKYKDGDEWKNITKVVEASGKKDAEQQLSLWHAVMEANHENGAADGGQADARKDTVADLVRWYIDGRATGAIGKGRKPAERSTLNYYENIAKHLQQHGGIWGIELDALDADTCERWAQQMAEDMNGTAQGDGSIAVGSRSTPDKALKFAKAVFSEANRKGKTDRNPMAGVEGFSVSVKKPNPLDVASAHRLYTDMLNAPDSSLSTAAALALFAGLREGEACGLKWADVDLTRNMELHVHRAIGRDGRDTYAKGAKNESSDRWIPLSNELAAILKGHRAEAKEACAGLGAKDPEAYVDGLFVVGELDGTWQDPHELGRKWRGYAEWTGLVGIEGKRCNFHDLRKTFSTICYSVTNHDVKSLHALLGHADETVTGRHYIGIEAEPLRRAVQAVADAIRQGTERPTADIRVADFTASRDSAEAK